MIRVDKFLTSLQSNVSFQIDLLSECLLTDRTHKALFTTLYHKMSHKAPSVSERLPTCCTCVWFFTSVSPKMKGK